MPGHLDVVEGLSLPARYRRGDIGRGGDQEPGNRFYFLTIFFFSWHARLQCCMRSFFGLASSLACVLAGLGRLRFVAREYVMRRALFDSVAGSFFFIGTPEGGNHSYVCGARAAA